MRGASYIQVKLRALLDSATGKEATLHRNRAALDRVMFMPSILHGELTTDLSTTLCGRDYPLPFGISPVGMSGLIWPDAERKLARAATKAGIPYSISTVATRTPEEVAPRLDPRRDLPRARKALPLSCVNVTLPAVLLSLKLCL